MVRFVCKILARESRQFAVHLGEAYFTPCAGARSPYGYNSESIWSTNEQLMYINTKGQLYHVLVTVYYVFSHLRPCLATAVNRSPYVILIARLP